MKNENPSYRPTVIDTFCGAGGMSLGFARAGFQILYATDSDAVTLQTYRHNFPTTFTRTADIRNVTIETIRADLTIHDSKNNSCHVRGDPLDRLDVLIGGPPCQGFSSQNPNGKGDDRNLLVLEFFRLVDELKPRFFVLENVRGLIGKRGGVIREGFIAKSEAAGYRINWRTLNSLDFGVAQKRKRVFIIGARGVRTNQFWLSDVLDMPINDSPPATVRDKIYDLTGDPSTLHVANHVHANLSPINQLRIKSLKQGEGRDSLPESLRLPTQTRHSNNGHRDTYGRLLWDQPAPTLTTAFHYISKGRFGHPEADRGLTLREGARLQGFPDNFLFHGNLMSVARQIGNSVSPPVAEAVATELKAFTDIWLSTCGNFLNAFGKEIPLGIVESYTIQMLFSRGCTWTNLRDIAKHCGRGLCSTRSALTRLTTKIEKQFIDPELILERRWGGWYRLRGISQDSTDLFDYTPGKAIEVLPNPPIAVSAD